MVDDPAQLDLIAARDPGGDRCGWRSTSMPG